jgi:hypothetical protein
MITIIEHLENLVIEFSNNRNDGFDPVFGKMQHSLKDASRDILIYIDKLLDNSFNQDGDQLEFVHFHFEKFPENYKDVIAEFLMIKLFHTHMENDDSINENERLHHEIEILRQETECPLILPSNNNRVQIRRIREARQRLVARLHFLESLPDTSSLVPRTILNIKVSTNGELEALHEKDLYSISSCNSNDLASYIVLNSDLTLNQLDKERIGDEASILDRIENFVIFDCEQKRIHRSTTFAELNNWNHNYDMNIKNLVLITFGNNEFKFSKLKRQIDRVYARYMTPNRGLRNGSYIVLPIESSILLNQNTQHINDINFHGEDIPVSWESFNYHISVLSPEGLYELRSIKLTRIYSLVFNQKIKEIVLEDIFSIDERSYFITEDTKNAIKELSPENLHELKGLLSDTLDHILASGWTTHVMSQLRGSTTILISHQALGNQVFTEEIRRSLDLSPRQTLTSWLNIDPESRKDILILDYQDTGRYPYNLNPNIFETFFSHARSASFLFLSLFYRSKFDWAEYNLSKDLLAILDHPIREEYFQFDDLRGIINNKRPNTEKTDWSLENNYQSEQSRQTVILKFEESDRTHTFNPSELFILRQDEIKLRVWRIDELSEIELSEEDMHIQQLDNLQEINIYNRIADLEREEKELNIIRKRFDLNESEPGRLWKILLKRKASASTEQDLYDDLSGFLSNEGSRIVSYQYFISQWISTDSNVMIPLEKKVFMLLCRYLGLPISYYRIMLRKRNAERRLVRKNNKQMNSLLSDLFEDGCFDDGSNPQEILEQHKEKYIKTYDFDEIGLAEDQIVENLTSLVDLLSPLIELKKVSFIENI